MSAPEWIEAATVAELTRRGKVVVHHGDLRLLVLWHDEGPRALDDVCIHKQRELHKGMVLGDRIVCPGHQWAFDLDTGWCKERERSQPRYRARVDGEVVLVDVSAPAPVAALD